jgi:hypothetical protein
MHALVIFTANHGTHNFVHARLGRGGQQDLQTETVSERLSMEVEPEISRTVIAQVATFSPLVYNHFAELNLGLDATRLQRGSNSTAIGLGSQPSVKTLPIPRFLPLFDSRRALR